MKKELLINCSVVLVILIIFSFIAKIIDIRTKDMKDVIYYKGKSYVLLEYNMDIFTYGNNNVYEYEEDEILPVEHDKWNVVYLDGDFYILDKQVEEATKYYADDNNYEWYFMYEVEDENIKVPLDITKENIEYLYNLDNMERKDTITFDDIEMFGDIVKISKDGFIQGIISLAYYDDTWYWKTEVMADETREYVIELPNSLSSGLIDLLKK